MAQKSYQLVMRSGPNPGKVFSLDKPEITIGRDTNNDIIITDAEVSRKHARLVFQAGDFVLEDLGSTNGTYADGQRLMGPHLLQPGELIMLGENIALMFETVVSEEETMVSAPTPQPSETPTPKITPTPTPRPVSTPVNRSQVSKKSAEFYAGEASTGEKKSNRTLLWAGCIILLILLCLGVAAVFLFDYLNLYCQPPFNVLFYCP